MMKNFLTFIQFGVCLAFFVLSIKTLFVENWNYFFVNSLLMVIFFAFAMNGFDGFKLKDYYTMRETFFRETGMKSTSFDCEDGDFYGMKIGDRADAQLQKSVVKKFHNLYTDSVVKEVIQRCKNQSRLRSVISEKDENVDNNDNSKKCSNTQSNVLEDIDEHENKIKAQDSLYSIIADHNLNRLTEDNLNKCGLDISYNSFESFNESIATTTMVKQKLNLPENK